MRDRLGIGEDDPSGPQRRGDAVDGPVFFDPGLIDGAGFGIACDKVTDAEEPALPWRTPKRRLAGGLAAGANEVVGEVNRRKNGDDLPEGQRQYDVRWDDHGAGGKLEEEIGRELAFELKSRMGGRKKSCRMLWEMQLDRHGFLGKQPCACEWRSVDA